MSGSQISQLVLSSKSNGLSEKEIIQIAKANGFTEEQVKQVIDNGGDSKSRSTPDGSPRIRKEIKTPKNSQIPPLEKSKSEDSYETFGNYLFKKPNLTFSPNFNIPTPYNYILGPGDEIIIDIWGASEMMYRQTVSSEGVIRISGIGPIYVNGLTIEKARVRIINRLTKIYAGLVANGSGTKHTYADVTLGKLRNIKVNIIGEAEVPGTYTLSSLATVFNALYAANGPSKNGSMRCIEVFRRGKKVATLDIYEFLTKGDESANIRLLDQDIINISSYKSRIKITGQVKRPGFYELIGDETLNHLLDYAGGFKANAYRHQIKMIRFTDKQKTIINIEKDLYNSFSLTDGDDLFVDKVLDRFLNRLRISGAVYRPGTYEYKPEMTLMDLINEADGLRGDAYLQKGIIVREKEDRKLKFMNFNLSEILNGNESDILLQMEDSIIISSVLKMMENKSVTVSGEVLNPSTFRYWENMKLGDLIFMAGGFRQSALSSFIEVSRMVNTDTTRSDSQMSIIKRIQLDSLTLSDEDNEFVIQPSDVIKVNKSAGYENLEFVTVKGEVAYPGKYSLKNKNERISDLIERCGGIKVTAFPEGSTLIRVSNQSNNSFTKLKDQSLESIESENNDIDDEALVSEKLISIDLPRILEKPTGYHDLVLMPGDIIQIPKTKGTVRLSGETLLFHYRMSLFGK